jgi:hypothetical protein
VDRKLNHSAVFHTGGYCLVDSTAQYIYGSDGTVSETGVHSEGLRCVVVLIGAYDLVTGQPIFGCVNQPFVQVDPTSNKYVPGFCLSFILNMNLFSL